MSLRLIVCASFALLPGVVAWWGGRKLARAPEDPLLADRLWKYRKRVGFFGWASTVFLAAVGGWHAFWLLPVLLAGLLAASYSLRRRLLGESWSFLAYAGFTVRLVAAFANFWILLVAAPWLAQAWGPGWVSPVLAGALLVFAKIGQRPLWRILLRFDPWSTEDPELRELLEKVRAAARVSPPVDYRIPVPGGRWLNAIALPAVREPAVALSQTLLETFEPREIAAIYAHELAHLEEMDARWARRRSAIEWGLVAIAILVSVLAPRVMGLLPLQLIWTAALLFGLSRYVAASRGREDRADRRAVELLGDPEALASALLRLHAGSLVPRRLAWEEARRLSHPSLARRLQSIRGEAPVQEAEGGVPEGTFVARGRREDQFLLLERDRVLRLSGVPAGTVEPERLSELAGSVSSERYEQLVELRVEPGRGGYRVRARGRDGSSWRFELAEQGGRELQARLDEVDHRLATPSDAGSAFHPGPTVRMLAGIVAVLAMLPPFSGVVALAGIVSALLPRAALLTATGVMGVAASLRGLLTSSSSLFGAQYSSWALLAASIPVLLMGFGERGHAGSRTARITGTVLLLFSVPLWTILLAAAWLGGPAIDPWVLHRLARSLPGLFLLPLGAGAAFLLTRSRRLQGLAVACLVLVGSGLWIGSRFFRSRYAPDPMLVEGAETEWSTHELQESELTRVSSYPYSARLSSDAVTFALSDDYGEDVPWQLESFAPGQRTEVQAIDLTFELDGRWLYLEGQSEDGARGRLCRAGYGGEEQCGPSLDLPWAARVAAGERGWWIWGRDRGSDEITTLSLISGGDLGEPRETLWQLDAASRAAVVEWSPLDAETAIAVRWGSSDGQNPLFLFFDPFAPKELWRIGPEGPERLLETRAELECYPLGPDYPGAICVAHDDREATIWQVGPEGAPRPLGSVTVSSEWLEVEPFPGGLVVEGLAGGILQLYPEAAPRWLILPTEDEGDVLAAARDHLLMHRFEPGLDSAGATLVLYD